MLQGDTDSEVVVLTPGKDEKYWEWQLSSTVFSFSVKKDEFSFVKSISRREEGGCEGHSSTDTRLELSDFIARSWEVVLSAGKRKGRAFFEMAGPPLNSTVVGIESGGLRMHRTVERHCIHQNRVSIAASTTIWIATTVKIFVIWSK
jgi:hypothetical protein